MVSKMSIVTDVQVTQATGTNSQTPKYHHRCWVFNCVLRMVIFLFVLDHTAFMISKNNLKGGLTRTQHTYLVPREASSVSGRS